MKREEIEHEQNYQEDIKVHANTFASIAENHNEKLGKLRELSEGFTKLIEERFDEVLIQIN